MVAVEMMVVLEVLEVVEVVVGLRVVDLVGMEGRILDILVRDVAALSIEDLSEAIVDASELRLDGGMGYALGGGGGGGSFDKTEGVTRGEGGTERTRLLEDDEDELVSDVNLGR